MEKRKRSSGDATHLSLLKRYPPRQHHTPDTESVEQHVSAEIAKRKPREVVVLPHLLTTKRLHYITRTIFHPRNFKGVSGTHSSFRCKLLCIHTCIIFIWRLHVISTLIEQDMNEIFRSECTRVKETFIQNWQKYVVAILMYSEGNKIIKVRSELNPSGKID